MRSFVEKLHTHKKALKSSSRDTYLRNIRRLRKVNQKLPVPEDDASWLKSKKLLAWFDRQNLSVRRHMATAARVALGVYGAESAEWKKRQAAAMKQFDTQRRQRELTPKQKENMPAKGFGALKDIIGQLRKELRHILARKSEEWSISDLLRVQDLVIISLYYDHPLRLDYATLTIGSDDGNCIYKNMKKPRGWHIKLTEYKTAKSLGDKVIKPNTRNQRLLNKFVPAVKNLTKHGFLLTNQSHKKMSKQVLSKRLMKITKKRSGRAFSVHLLRILFAMENRDVLESAKQVSDKLLHSQKQSLEYAKKDPKKATK